MRETTRRHLLAGIGASCSLASSGVLGQRLVPDPGTSAVFEAARYVDAAAADNLQGFVKLAADVQAAGGGVIEFPPGRTYQILGTSAPVDQLKVFDFSKLSSLAIRMNGSRIVTSANLNATGGATPVHVYVFYFADCDDVDLDFDIEQTDYHAKSSKGGFLGAFFAGTCRNVRVRGTMLGGNCGIAIVRDPRVPLAKDRRAHNFDIDLHTRDTFYPLNCRFNGDNLEARLFTEGAGRSYFVYGVSNHRVLVDSDGHQAGYDDCLIKSYALPSAGGEPNDDSATSNIDLVYKRRNNASDVSDSTAISLAFDQLGSSYNPGRISSVRIAFDCDFAGMRDPQVVCAFARSGPQGVYDKISVAHVLENIDVSGTLRDTRGPLSDPLIVDFFHFQGQDPTGIRARNIKFHDIVSLDGQGGSQAPRMGFDGRCLVDALTLDNIVTNGTLALANMAPGMVRMSNVVTASLVSPDVYQRRSYTVSQLTRAFVAGLPVGLQIFVTDGREPGQPAGGGTGVFAYKNAAGAMRSAEGGPLER